MVLTRTNLTHMRTIGRYGSEINLIGMHTVENIEGPNTAENVAEYFKTVKASAHWCTDNNSRVRVVRDEDMAWTLPGANRRSLNIEMAGWARQTTEEWLDPYSRSMLEITALCCAEWCKKYDIPVRRLTDDQIRNHEKGFAGHVDVNRIYQKSTHWDPGPNFPWNYFLGRVREHLKVLGTDVPPLGPTQVNPDNSWFSSVYIIEVQKKLNRLGHNLVLDGVLGPITKDAVKKFQREQGLLTDGIPGPITTAALDRAIATLVASRDRSRDVRRLQRAVRTIADNHWGEVTDRHLGALRAASRYHGNKFPYGVRFAQKVVGALQDGNWGPRSWEAHTRTVVEVQKALNELGFYKGRTDGVWAAMTEAAYKAARSAFRR